MPPKGPPPVIKPKPKNLAPSVGKKLEIGTINRSVNEDEQYIASLRGNLKATGVNSFTKPVDQSVVNSVVSQPIGLTLDPDALDSESDTEQQPAVRSRLSAPPASESKLKLPPLSGNANLNPAVTPSSLYNPLTASPFKSSVSKSFPPPPQRNVVTSPLRKKSLEPTSDSLSASPPSVLSPRLENTSSRETIDYAEGMRSPLKKNISSASITSSFPPPPKRNVARSSATIKNDNKEIDDHTKSPLLPSRKQSSKNNIQVELSDKESDDSPPPKLPSRNRAISLSKKKNEYIDEEYQDDDDDDNDNDSYNRIPRRDTVGNIRDAHPRRRDSHQSHHRDKYNQDEDSDDYDRLRDPNNRKVSHNHGNGHHRETYNHQPHRERRNEMRSVYDSLSDDDEYDDYGRKKGGRGSGGNGTAGTSQFLSNAKSFSKDSFFMAKEKSAPLAKQAMGGLSKMKNKIKNSMMDDQEYSCSDNSDDDRYKRNSARGENEDGAYGKSYRRSPDKRDRRGKPSREEEVNYYDDDGDYEEENDHSSRRSDRSTPELPKRRERGERVSSRNTPEPPRKPSRPTTAKKYYSDEEESEDDKDTRNNYDESIDEDRPSLPTRKPVALRTQNVGVPLPGLTDDIKLKPAIKSKPKPSIPSKEKPILPPKKTQLLKEVKPEIVQPPPSRRNASNSSSTISNPPPVPPSRNRAPAAPPSRNTGSVIASWKEPKINLDFKSMWFLSDDTSKLPKDLQGLNFQCSHGFVGTKEFKIYAFRLDDLATLKLKLVWKKGSSTPYDSLTDEVEFIPPPTASESLLVSGNEKYGEHIANWCEVKEGQTVGNGECWTLAHDALEKGCGKHAFVSNGFVHGALIATYKGKKGGIPDVVIPPISDEISRGDILQFKSCVFTYPQRTMIFGSPDHTAIILDVKPSDDSDKDNRLKWFEIVHQNIGGVQKVRVGDIDIGKLTEGEIRVFRPVDAEWIADLAEVVI